MESSAVSARAALDAARAVFGYMSGSGSAPPAGDAEAATPAGRSLAAWRAAETILRAVTGRSDLSGQALVGEARRMERLTLGDAHVLIALHGWMERQRDPAYVGSHDAAPPGDSERSAAREAMLALEHAVATVQREAPRDGGRDATSDFTVSGTRRSNSFAPPDATSTAGLGGAAIGSAAPGTAAFGGQRGVSGGSAASGVGAGAEGAGAWSSAASHTNPPRRAGSATATDALVDDAGYAAPRSRRVLGSPAFLIGAVALLLLAAAGAWYALAGRKGRAYEEGTAAYARGSREAANIAFAKAAADDPNDARPLIYLGRIARESGDLARARRFLDRAVRLAPNSAIAQREMGSTLLADGNPDLARRFYVRALEIDPADRLSQGFLACALHRLGRIDDARRFAERAGPGDWTPCLSTPVMPMAPGGAIAPGMMPGGVIPSPPGTVPRTVPPQ